MKRSEVNQLLENAKALLEDNGFRLPSFAYWGLDDWKNAKIDTIKKTMLGWDITDFGSGDYYKIGAVLFTIRNGKQGEGGLGTPYAEKIIVVPDGGRLPLHYHETKTEDIINRGGGTLWMKLYNAKEDNSVDYQSDVQVYCDGIKKTFKAGEEIEIGFGDSVTLTPRIYHVFGAKDGDLICGEVSSINDDNTDNYFAEPVSRFAKIEEDELILHPLCNEYDQL